MAKKSPVIIFTEEETVPDSFFIRPIGKGTSDSKIFRLAYHRIFFIQSGSGNFTIDHKQFEVSDTELFLAAKGQLISFNVNVVGYELSFGDCFWEKSPQSANNCKAVLFNHVVNNQNIILNDHSCAELAILFSAISAEFNKPDYINKPDALAAYLKIIMIKIANANELLAEARDDYDSKFYRNFLTLVGKDYTTTHEVAYFASKIGISARKLSDLCKKYSGKGAKDVINDQLIAEAKRFLQFSSIPIKEIAYELNFSTAEQFSHFFKKNTSHSPQLYRSKFVNIDMQFS